MPSIVRPVCSGIDEMGVDEDSWVKEDPISNNKVNKMRTRDFVYCFIGIHCIISHKVYMYIGILKFEKRCGTNRMNISTACKYLIVTRNFMEPATFSGKNDNDALQ